MRLKNGNHTSDPRLGRVPQWDERNLDYLISRAVYGAQLRSYTWRVGVNLDQGQKPACVGFAWEHEAAARPKVVKDVSNADALELYMLAQTLDEWPGEQYEGTSVLGGAKAAVQKGHLKEYRWALTVDDLARAVGHHGPAVLGIEWTQDMFDPSPEGFITPTGQVAGGHAILCNAVHAKLEYFTLWNSWGTGWGVNGCAKVRFSDMEKLLANSGEACIPTIR